jgi:hypothetical protein
VKRSTFAFQFVEFIPKQLDEGELYVSLTYATASHRCFCGCGMKVVTPLSPTDWRLVFNGDAVSLEPSIGNWSYPCRSHYILRNNRVLWSGPMSPTEINAIRDSDRLAKQRYYRRDQQAQTTAKPADPSTAPPSRSTQARPAVWRRILDWWSGPPS